MQDWVFRLWKDWFIISVFIIQNALFNMKMSDEDKAIKLHHYKVYWIYRCGFNYLANIYLINLDVSMEKHPVKGIEFPEKKDLFAFKSNSIYCS